VCEGGVFKEKESGNDTDEIINGAIIDIDVTFVELDVWVEGDEFEDFWMNFFAGITPRGGGFDDTEIVRDGLSVIIIRFNGLHLLIFYYI